LVEAKLKREKKRQLGQFMTPQELANEVVSQAKVDWSADGVYLEPSFGEGSFLITIIEELLDFYGNRDQDTIDNIFANQLHGIELDSNLYKLTLAKLEAKYGKIKKHNLINNDFFKVQYMTSSFDLVIGNPPFGGSFDPSIEDSLDKRFGMWNSHKLKKETYSFFIAAALELLVDGGRLIFLSSDTFLTINTMAGLRYRLMDQANCKIKHLLAFSNETTQTVLVLDAMRGEKSDSISLDGKLIPRSSMDLTANFSWKIDDRHAKYFTGTTIGEYMVCTSGMTIGDNELFTREIFNGHVLEPYEFEFFQEKVTLIGELEKARLNRLTDQMRKKIEIKEQLGETRRSVRAIKLESPKKIELPHKHYRYYNKALPGIVYTPPKYVVYWKDDGDAVLTYKKNGSWYLHGVGGAKFFGRKGLTWSLVSPKINMRFLDEGHILDSGAPCAFLREDINEDELWFIFAWTLSDLASEILKSVINHTRNIQGKDIERLPYPIWVTENDKKDAINLIKKILAECKEGRKFSRQDAELRIISNIFLL